MYKERISLPAGGEDCPGLNAVSPPGTQLIATARLVDISSGDQLMAATGKLQFGMIFGAAAFATIPAVAAR
jgi:hypothetical protein